MNKKNYENKKSKLNCYEYTLTSSLCEEVTLYDIVYANSIIDASRQVLNILDALNDIKNLTKDGKFELQSIMRKR